MRLLLRTKRRISFLNWVVYCTILIFTLQSEVSAQNQSIGINVFSFRAMPTGLVSSRRFSPWGLSSLSYTLNRQRYRYKLYVGFSQNGPHRIGTLTGKDPKNPEEGYYKGIDYRIGLHSPLALRNTLECTYGLDFMYRTGVSAERSQLSSYFGDYPQYRHRQCMVSPSLGFQVRLNKNLALQANMAGYIGFDFGHKYHEPTKPISFTKYTWYYDPIQEFNVVYYFGE